SGQPTWSQCGGKGYTGKTDCREEDKCKQWNDYYSQCIPRTQQRGADEGEGDDIDIPDTIDPIGSGF
ncbi:unnamed protein product, partial [Aphanomyces euteiches]